MEVIIFIKECTGVQQKVLHRQTISEQDIQTAGGFSQFVKAVKVLFPRCNCVEFNTFVR